MITYVYKKINFSQHLSFYCGDFNYQSQSLIYSVQIAEKNSIYAIFNREKFKHFVGLSSLIPLKKQGGRKESLFLLKGDLEKSIRVFRYAYLYKTVKTRLALFNRGSQKMFQLLSLALFRDFVLETTLKFRAKQIKEDAALMEKDLSLNKSFS